MKNNCLIGRLFALLTGAIMGFFIVFNSIFSDVFSWQQRIFTFLLVIVFYGLISLLFGFFSPQLSWRWGVWIAAPAVLFVIFYSISDGFRPVLYLFYIILTLACACGGAYLGAITRSNRNASV